MAFAGTFGGAAKLVPPDLIFSAKFGVGTSYDADGNLQFTTPGATLVTPDRVDELLISGAGDILAALINNSDDGSAADTGVLVTAAAGANQHGLPANFGLGRGKWVNADNAKLPSSINVQLDFQQSINTVQGVTNVGGPYVRALVQAGGDLTIAIKNMSEVILASSAMRLTLRHTIISV